MLRNNNVFFNNIASLLGNFGLLLGINEVKTHENGAKTHENAAFCNVFGLSFVTYHFKLFRLITPKEST